jgi:UDPglucose 6-dehydrogenase
MTTTPRNLTMIGTGYVGLVSGTCFAEKGFQVTCLDLDTPRFKALTTQGIIPIHEPGLDELVKKNVAAGRLKFTTHYADAIASADVVFIGVGTPQDEDGSADLSHVLAAATQLAPHLTGYTLVVNKSTVPVGTGAKVAETIRKANPTAHFDVASNPEFLREGEAIEDFMRPDRIVVGVESEEARQVLKAVYKPFTDAGYPLFITNRPSAELIKYAANAFLATKITFINELIALCEATGADVLDISKGMGMDARIAPRFLNPGPGYGGSCFPKDTNALAKTARDFNLHLKLVEQTIVTNNNIKQQMITKIEQAMGGQVAGKTIGVLGLAFKANTDDMRDASALTILPALQAKGAKIQAYDPAAMAQAKSLMPNLTYATSTLEALKDADAMVILTEWPEFRMLDLAIAKQTMRGNVLIDLRNLFDNATATQAGLVYTGLGRPRA